jgi:hypothetical protein
MFRLATGWLAGGSGRGASGAVLLAFGLLRLAMPARLSLDSYLSQVDNHPINNSKSVNSIVKLLSLTHPASLSDISESDKDTAMLQVIIAEIGNLRLDLQEVSNRALPQKYMSVAAATTSNLRHSLTSLDIRIKELHDEVVAIKDGFFPSKDFLRQIDNCELKLNELFEQARAKSDDLSLEYIALLSNQLRVARNRYNKYLRDSADKAE